MSDPYELHFLLLRLKAGDLNFVQFLARAKAWAEGILQEQTTRPPHYAICG
jgi:hypothetical protein